MTTDPRTRALDAAVVVFGRVGIAKATVEDVAAEAGVSRATVYRWFPGGRDQLVFDAITSEVGRFFDELSGAVVGVHGLVERLARMITAAHRTLAQHEVFQKVLHSEPERLLPQLSSAGPVTLQRLRRFIEPMLVDEPLRAGLDLDDAADWLARMVLSLVVAPGRWDLDDPDVVEGLVRRQLIAGVVATAPA